VVDVLDGQMVVFREVRSSLQSQQLVDFPLRLVLGGELLGRDLDRLAAIDLAFLLLHHL